MTLTINYNIPQIIFNNNLMDKFLALVESSKVPNVPLSPDEALLTRCWLKSTSYTECITKYLSLKTQVTRVPKAARVARVVRVVFWEE